MESLQRHCILGLVLCLYLLSNVSAQTTATTGGDGDGSWEWKPLVIALGAVAGTMLIIVNIIIVVRCCGCCVDDTVDKQAFTRGASGRAHLRDSKRSGYSDGSYYRGHGPLPYRLRPEVAAALNPPRESEIGKRDTADSVSLEAYDRPPVPPPNRGFSNEAFMDLDTGEPYHEYNHNTTSAAAYSSIPRELDLHPVTLGMVAVPRPDADMGMVSVPRHDHGMSMVAVPRPAVHVASNIDTLNSEVYPNVTADDYLTGRFRPPTQHT